jgi:hypothetical protein
MLSVSVQLLLDDLLASPDGPFPTATMRRRSDAPLPEVEFAGMPSSLREVMEAPTSARQ